MLKVQQSHSQSQTHVATDTSFWAWLEGAGPIAISLSFLLHLSVALILTYGLPHFSEPPTIDAARIVAVEFVEIAEKTESNKKESRVKNKDEQTKSKTVRPDNKPKPKDRPDKPKSAPTVNAKSQPLTVRDNKSNVPPPPSEEVSVPEEKPEPKRSLAPSKPSKPNKRPKRPDPKKEAAKQQQAFDSVLKNLQISEESSSAEDEGENQQTAAPQTPTLGQRITISELDALRSQLAGCWNVLAGANFDKALVVYIKLYMNPDRTIRRYEIKDKLRYSTDSFFKAAADSAVRAVNNPSCSPLNLPPGKYDQWKEITIKFDPREML